MEDDITIGCEMAPDEDLLRFEPLPARYTWAQLARVTRWWGPWRRVFGIDPERNLSTWTHPDDWKTLYRALDHGGDTVVRMGDFGLWFPIRLHVTRFGDKAIVLASEADAFDFTSKVVVYA